MTTTTMIRKGFFTVRRGDRFAMVRRVRGLWTVAGTTFSDLSAAMSAATALVSA
jgi:hypothetical protein